MSFQNVLVTRTLQRNGLEHDMHKRSHKRIGSLLHSYDIILHLALAVPSTISSSRYHLRRTSRERTLALYGMSLPPRHAAQFSVKEVSIDVGLNPLRVIGAVWTLNLPRSASVG
jgi:hypothetical protein